MNLSKNFQNKNQNENQDQKHDQNFSLPGLYLKTLSLKNFATFENQTIEFNSRFNAIVGETGSGKSLILDALQIIFGARADKKLIRKNFDFSTIEATFISCDPKIKQYFHEIGHPFDGEEIIVKKIIYLNENAKSYINFQACNSSTLQNFSKRFIDLVGQFENQKLLSEDYQLILLDNFGKLSKSIIDYQNIFSVFNEKQKQLEKMFSEKKQKEEREDYIRFQLREISELNPSIEDENQLLKDKEIVLNLEKRQSVYQSLSQIISDDEWNLLNLLSQAIQKIEKNSHLFRPEILQKIIEAKILVEEVSYDLSKDDLEQYQSLDINFIMDRIDHYQRLKRKFGGSVEQLVQSYEKFLLEVESLEHSSEQILEISNEITALNSNLLKLAQSLHQERGVCAEKLSSLLTEKVRELKMNGASIKIELTPTKELNSKGCTKIEFTAETNPGEGFFKIKEIASGGELSRILLSLRQILSSNDSISVFLFDEIETGIGGETALAIGKSLQNVSKHSQVISITHLPQIAHFADKLIWVSKETINLDHHSRTVSLVEEISGEKLNRAVRAMNPI